MKSLIRTVLIAAVFFSCHRSDKTFTPKPAVFSLKDLPVNADTVKGVYIGDFNGSPISIVLHFISGRHISGYDVHKGLKRNIAGTMSLGGRVLQLDLSEPGTNQYDGRFKIFFDTVTKAVKGWWSSFSDKSKVITFTLSKKIGVDLDDNFGWLVVDSLQNSFEFKKDGSCTYAYLSGDTTTGQQLTVKGSYTIEQDSLLTIFWENNTVFPSKKSAFHIHFSKPINEDDRKLRSITLEDGRTFNELYD